MDELRSELSSEKKQRERLENLYYKRDDQVLQLRSTFDQSLNTLSKDTRNIKSILGKSLKKLDRDMGGVDVGETLSDATDDDVELSPSERAFNGLTYTPSAGRYSSTNGRYSNLPQHHRHSKSAVELPVDDIRFKYSTPKVTSPHNNNHHSQAYVSPSYINDTNNNSNNKNSTTLSNNSAKRSATPLHHMVASNIPTHARSSYHDTPTRDVGVNSGRIGDRFRENKRYSKWFEPTLTNNLDTREI